MRTKSKPCLVAVAAAGFCLLISGMAVCAESSNAFAPDASIRAAEAWAFPLNPPSPVSVPKADPRKIVHVPESLRSYTQAQLDTDHFIPDWFPADHPRAPHHTSPAADTDH